MSSVEMTVGSVEATKSNVVTAVSDEGAAKNDSEGHRLSTRLLWNRVALQEFDLAARIAAAAKDERYAIPLFNRGVTPVSVEALLRLIMATRNDTSEAIVNATESMSSTRREGAARARLLGIVREIQSAARQKHAGNNPVKLRAYAIGTNLAGLSLTTLTGIIDGIAAQLLHDPLPGISEERRQELLTALADYRSVDALQVQQQGAAIHLRMQRDKKLRAIKAARKTIQFAANAQWPARNPDNQEARAAFQLPANRPYAG